MLKMEIPYQDQVNVEDAEDEIDLKPLIRTVWRKRKFILFGTGLITLLAVTTSLLVPNTYITDGILLVSTRSVDQKTPSANMKFSDYQKIFRAFTDVDRFIPFLKTSMDVKPQELMEFEKRFRTPEKLAETFKPVYEDGRDPDALHPAKDIIGFNIFGKANSPEAAQEMVLLIGKHIENCLLYDTLYDYIDNNYSSSQRALKLSDNSLIEDEFGIRQVSAEKDDLLRLKREYPTAAIEIKQVFSVKGEGYQYVSPTGEIIKAESAISSLKRDQTRLTRDKEMAQIKFDFFAQAENVIRSAGGNGEIAFKNLSNLSSNFFKNKDMTKDTYKEVFNTISKDLNDFGETYSLNGYYGPLHFAADIPLPKTKSTPHRGLIVLETLFTSMLVLTLCALMSDWWRNNKSVLILDEPLR